MFELSPMNIVIGVVILAVVIVVFIFNIRRELS